MAETLEGEPTSELWATPKVGHAQVCRAFKLLNLSRTGYAAMASAWALHMFFTMSPALDPTPQAVATGSGGLAILVLLGWLAIPFRPALVGILITLISTTHLALLQTHGIVDPFAVGLVLATAAMCVPLIRARILLIQDPDGLVSARRFGRLTRSSRPRRIVRSFCGAVVAFVLLAGWQGGQTYTRGRIPDSLVPVMDGFRSAWDADDPTLLRAIMTVKAPKPWTELIEELTTLGFDRRPQISARVTVRAYDTQATVVYALGTSGRVETHWEVSGTSWQFDYLFLKR